MANLLGQNIGTNYKGILNLDTINTPLDATLRAVTDGEGNASPLQLSTDAVSVGAISGARLGIKGSGTTASTTSLLVQNSDGLELLSLDDIGGVRLGGDGNTTTKANIKLDAFSGLFNVTAAKFGNWNGSVYAVFSGLGKSDALFAFGNDTTTASTRMHIKGLGTTSATTALLVQNSAGADMLKITDNGASIFGGSISSFGNIISGANVQVVSTGYFKIDSRILISSSSSGILKLANINDNDFNRLQFGGATNAYPSLKRALNNFEVKNADDTFGAGLSVGAALNSSAILQADSTTQGFLPPRMTTTQKNAIATPASGLIVYDETTNKLACYNGTSWNDLF